MDLGSLVLTIGIFVLFLIIAGYYFIMKQSKDKSLLVVIFGIIFVLASFSNLLDFILPILFLLFFISIFNQYLRKRQLHQLLWSISLFMFFLTTLFQAIATLLNTWNLLMLQVYYVFASFQVLLLGVGELYLLSKHNVINRIVNIAVIYISGFFWMLFGFIYLSYTNNLIFLLIAMFGLVVLAYGTLDIIFAILTIKYKSFERVQLTGFQFTNVVLVSSVIMFIFFVYFAFTTVNSGYVLNKALETVITSVWGGSTNSVVRGFAPLFTVGASMYIFLGSIYSYILWQYGIRKSKGKFSLGTGLFNIYFALGVAIFVAGGSLQQLGVYAILYISELLGGILMYFGFLESDRLSMDMILDVVTLRFLHKQYQTSESVPNQSS